MEKSILLVKKFLGLVEMTSRLVNASFSLPKWQAGKMIFFAPWCYFGRTCTYLWQISSSAIFVTIFMSIPVVPKCERLFTRHFWFGQVFIGTTTFFFPIQLYWTYTQVQLTFTKDNLQQNENYNLKLTKKKPNTIKTLVVTKIKWECNQLCKQNFIPYLKETKKQTILMFWTLFHDQSYKKYIFLD